MGNNSNVDIRIMWTFNPINYETGILVSEHSSQASGRIKVNDRAQADWGLAFWHDDLEAEFETTTLTIQTNITPFYFHAYMILIYVFGGLLLIIPISVPGVLRRRKKGIQSDQMVNDPDS
ncbi:MAG: hypothetical protein FK733_18575 [Asgard group archaeon]|nr:hypothetical protein [Asgard group archaeon]